MKETKSKIIQTISILFIQTLKMGKTHLCCQVISGEGEWIVTGGGGTEKDFQDAINVLFLHLGSVH